MPLTTMQSDDANNDLVTLLPCVGVGVGACKSLWPDIEKTGGVARRGRSRPRPFAQEMSDMAQKATTAVKKLRGSKNLNLDAPSPARLVNLTPPKKGLGRIGRAFWRRHAPILAEAGVLTEADSASFLLLCQCYELTQTAWKAVEEDGLLRTDENGVRRKHPALQIFRDSLIQYRGLAAEFGLTPVARESLHVENPTAAGSDYEGFLRGKRQTS